MSKLKVVAVTAAVSIGSYAMTPRYKIRTPRCEKCNSLCNDPRAKKCPRCRGRLR